MIKAEEARELAEAFVNHEPGRFRYEFVDTRFVEGSWSVVFAVFTPERNELDGPVVIIVDPETKRARSFSM